MHLNMLRPVYEQAGPWASVYLDTSGSERYASETIDLRWRALREQLEAAQADPRTVDAIEAAIRRDGPSAGEGGRAFFARDGAVGFAHPLTQPPVVDMASWSLRPHTAALVRALGEHLQWVRADVHHTGGTLTGQDGSKVQIRGDSPDDVTAGSFSLARDQRATAQDWDRTSDDIAAAVAAMVDQNHADVIVLSGDIQARELVINRLPPLLAGKVVEVDYESPTAGHDAVLDQATTAAVASVAETTRQAMIERFRNGFGDGNSVRGLAAVADAARERRLEVLVLGAEPKPGDAWVDPSDPTFVGPDERAVQDYGVSAPAREDAEEALIGAAAATGADVVTMDADDTDLPEGIGAIVRFSI